MKQLINKILKTSSLFFVIALIFTVGCQQPKPDASQEAKTLIDKYVEVWNGGNLSELDAIMDSNYIYHSNQLPEVNGIDGLKSVVSAFRTAYPDLKLVLADAVYTDNKAVGRWVINGTNTGAGEMPPTGKSVSFWGIAIIHIADGKLKEEWTAFDNQSLMEQLGFTMMPPSGTNQ